MEQIRINVNHPLGYESQIFAATAAAKIESYLRQVKKRFAYISQAQSQAAWEHRQYLSSPGNYPNYTPPVFQTVKVSIEKITEPVPETKPRPVSPLIAAGWKSPTAAPVRVPTNRNQPNTVTFDGRPWSIGPVNLTSGKQWMAIDWAKELLANDLLQIDTRNQTILQNL